MTLFLMYSAFTAMSAAAGNCPHPCTMGGSSTAASASAFTAVSHLGKGKDGLL